MFAFNIFLSLCPPPIPLFASVCLFAEQIKENGPFILCKFESQRQCHQNRICFFFLSFFRPRGRGRGSGGGKAVRNKKMCHFSLRCDGSCSRFDTVLNHLDARFPNSLPNASPCLTLFDSRFRSAGIRYAPNEVQIANTKTANSKTKTRKKKSRTTAAAE